MEQSPSWKANNSSASPEISRILWNRKVYYRSHKNPLCVAILSQINPVYALPTIPLTWILIVSSHLHIGLPSALFPSCFPISLPNMPHMSRSCRSSCFHQPDNICWGVQIMKLLIVQFLPAPCYLFPLRPKYPSQHPVLKHPQFTFLPQCERPNRTPIQYSKQSYSSVYFNLDSRWSHWNFSLI